MVVQSPSASPYKISGQGASEIAASIEAGVARGDLPPGSPLPPIRDLAADLSVNPNTVSAAYRLLRDRGAVETAGRRGTRVRERPATAPRNLAMAVPPGTRDLADGSPDPALLPLIDLAGRPDAPPRLYHGDPLVPALAAAARARLAADAVPADHLTATFGAGDAIDRVLTAHLRPGDAVAVEDPAWSAVPHLLAALGLVPVPLPVDESGPTPAGLARALARGARAAIITSRAHNPTGAAVTAPRAAALRETLAAHPAVLLIEDDHGADINADHPLHTLAGATASWAHIRSVSKAYGPDLRLAVMSADPTTSARVAGRLRLGAGWVSSLIQNEVARLWTDPATTAVVTRAAATYAHRRETLISALRDRGIEAHGRTGINVWVPVPEEASVVSALLTAGWAVAPGAWFRLESPPAVRITVATLADPEAEAVADALAGALESAGIAKV